MLSRISTRKRVLQYTKKRHDASILKKTFERVNMKISVKVFPNAFKNECLRSKGKPLKVRLTTSPEKGKTNAALISLLAKEYGVPKSSVKILKGKNSQNKLIQIDLSASPV